MLFWFILQMNSIIVLFSKVGTANLGSAFSLYLSELFKEPLEVITVNLFRAYFCLTDMMVGSKSLV